MNVKQRDIVNTVNAFNCDDASRRKKEKKWQKIQNKQKNNNCSRELHAAVETIPVSCKNR